MPGRKSYKKYYKRRYRKTLKKSNIFSKKSAKSQAVQIYALNKKINKIYKQTAPEILTYSTNQLSGFNYVFMGSSSNNDNGFYQQNGVISRLFNSSGHYSGSDVDGAFNFKGQLLRVKNISLNLHFSRMAVNSQLAGSSDPIFDGKSIGSHEKVSIGRITIIRLSNSVNDVRSMNFIHRLYKRVGVTNANVWNTEDTIYGPLNDTITTMGKVVYDRKFKMGYYGSGYAFRNIKIKLKGGSYRRPENATANTIMGKDYVVCITYGMTGIGATDTGFMSDGDLLQLSTSCKIAYVDDTQGYVEAVKTIEFNKDEDIKPKCEKTE